MAAGEVGPPEVDGGERRAGGGASGRAERERRAGGSAGVGGLREADSPAEWRGLGRDGVRLLVSDDEGHHHTRFTELAARLGAGDLLVVNESATLPASLPARGRIGDFRLNLSTRYGPELWLAEPRWSAAEPGPLPLRAGDVIVAGGVTGRLAARYPAQPRLWFVAFGGDIDEAMRTHGDPIRYGYIRPPLPTLAEYQTIFARLPGSAEMPSAARPFTNRVLKAIARRGVRIARVALHAGVSSLDTGDAPLADHALPEPFQVSSAAAEAVNLTRARDGRVLAVGSTVVRALESAARNGTVHPAAGFTRVLVEPARGAATVDGIITGLHDARSTHHALLNAIGGERRVHAAYEQAVRHAYLWHEFGDSHLLWKPGRARFSS